MNAAFRSAVLKILQTDVDRARDAFRLADEAFNADMEKLRTAKDGYADTTRMLLEAEQLLAAAIEASDQPKIYPINSWEIQAAVHDVLLGRRQAGDLTGLPTHYDGILALKTVARQRISDAEALKLDSGSTLSQLEATVDGQLKELNTRRDQVAKAEAMLTTAQYDIDSLGRFESAQLHPLVFERALRLLHEDGRLQYTSPTPAPPEAISFSAAALSHTETDSVERAAKDVHMDEDAHVTKALQPVVQQGIPSQFDPESTLRPETPAPDSSHRGQISPPLHHTYTPPDLLITDNESFEGGEPKSLTPVDHDPIPINDPTNKPVDHDHDPTPLEDPINDQFEGDATAVDGRINKSVEREPTPVDARIDTPAERDPTPLQVVGPTDEQLQRCFELQRVRCLDLDEDQDWRKCCSCALPATFGTRCRFIKYRLLPGPGYGRDTVLDFKPRLITDPIESDAAPVSFPQGLWGTLDPAECEDMKVSEAFILILLMSLSSLGQAAAAAALFDDLEEAITHALLPHTIRRNFDLNSVSLCGTPFFAGRLVLLT